MKITIVGTGYVGMSLSVLLAQKNEVIALDIDKVRVDKINNKISTVKDSYIENFLDTKELSIVATTDPKMAYKNADYIIIATPTNYDESTSKFDTSSVDTVIKDAMEMNKGALIVIKSTIPIGHTKKLQDNFLTDRIVFSPEFLREGSALEDNLYPSRIIVGGSCLKSQNFASILIDSSLKDNVDVFFMSSTEAEAVKLFANTYLAMRVSFFNELDSYALVNNLNTKDILNGVCSDERIGKQYNNPSFGYGGYCLPKDSKQLLSNYQNVPQNLIEAIVLSNDTRKEFISNEIIKINPNIVGFYRLNMKEGSDNSRSSAIKGVIDRIKNKNIRVLLYEPSINTHKFDKVDICNDLDEFKKLSDLIVTNRHSPLLKDVEYKVFSRDIFQEN